MADRLCLGFDSSAAHCAAALILNDQVLVSRQIDMVRGQAEHLMPLLQDVLTEAGKSWRDLDVLGVGTGPGNFTGIRIAVAAARGLALSLKIPAIGITATEALARAVNVPVIASGGVSSLADLIALRDTGIIEGAISGRALYDGALDLSEALAALR